MESRRAVSTFNDGHTRIWGYSVGPYPMHHFIVRPGGAEESVWLPIWLDETGWDDWVEGCERRRANSKILAIEYVREGVFEFEQGGSLHRVEPGGVFIVRPGGTAMMRTASRAARKRTMIARGSCIEPVLNSCGLGAVDVVEGLNETLMDSLFDRAEQVFRDAPAGFRRETSSIVFEVILALSEALARKSLPEPVNLALELFARRLDGSISLPELAAHCGCSAVTLQRLFRQSLGQTPLERFIGMKMELAKSLLLFSSEPVKEISRRLGYSSQLYFSTEFRKRAGASPVAWRKSHSRSDAKGLS